MYVHWITSSKDAHYQTVLSIRSRAYAASGKVIAESAHESMADGYDKHARIALLFDDGGSPVGTIRVFTEPEAYASDYSRHAAFRESFRDLSCSVTASRLAIDPHHQGRGYLKILHDLVPAEARLRNRNTALASAAGGLLTLYESFGWKRTGVSYSNTQFSGIQHECIRLDVAEWFSQCFDYSLPSGRRGAAPNPGS